MEKIYLSVIIPAYNEEKRISKTLPDVSRYLSEQKKYTYEIIVVNDGSSDNTSQIVNKFAESVNCLGLIDNKKNHGKGWAVRQGMLESKGEIRLFMDSDNSTTINHFEKMVPFFKNSYQVVIGSRHSKDAAGAKRAVVQPLHRRLIGYLGNPFVRLAAVPGIYDTRCGFKAFTAQAAKDIFSRCFIDRWGFDIEVLVLAKKLGYRIGIIPVYWIDNSDSRATWRSHFKTLEEILKVRWNLIRGKYDRKK